MNGKVKKTHDPIIKGWMLISLTVFAVVFSINSLLISPAIKVISNDILYSDTLLPVVLSYLREIFELAAISVFYAVMICVLYKRGKGRIRDLFILFVAAAAYKYLASTVMSWVVSGSIPSSWALDMSNVLFFTSLEFLQLVIIYCLIRPEIERFNAKRALAEKKLSVLDYSTDVTVPCAYPFEKLYDRENCLCRSAFVCALVIFIAKLFGDVVSDIWVIIYAGFPSEWVTWVLMAVNYLSKVIFAGIAYFIIYGVMSRLLRKTEK